MRIANFETLYIVYISVSTCINIIGHDMMYRSKIYRVGSQDSRQNNTIDNRLCSVADVTCTYSDCWYLVAYRCYNVSLCWEPGQATSMLLGVAALAGNVGPALVGFLDPGDNHRSQLGAWKSNVLSSYRTIRNSFFLWQQKQCSMHPAR